MRVKYLLVCTLTKKCYGLFDTEVLAENFGERKLELPPHMYQVTAYPSYDDSLKKVQDKLSEIANIGEPMKAVYAIHDALGLIFDIINDLVKIQTDVEYIKVPSEWATKE